MSWEKLPTEIVIYIFKIRNEIRNEIRNKASQTIQNAWLKYISLDINALDEVLNIEIDEFNDIIVSIPSTHLILKNCLNMVSGKRNLSFWKIILENLHYSLRKGYIWYDDGQDTPEAQNYRKIKLQYKKLVNKFNF